MLVTYSSGSGQTATIPASKWEEWGKTYKFFLFLREGEWQNMCYAPPLCDWCKAKAGDSSGNSIYYINGTNATVSHRYSGGNEFNFSVANDNTHDFKIYGIPF